MTEMQIVRNILTEMKNIKSQGVARNAFSVSPKTKENKVIYARLNLQFRNLTEEMSNEDYCHAITLKRHFLYN